MSASIRRIAAVQMQIVDADGEVNRTRAAELIDSAGTADLYLLPELWTTGYAIDEWPVLAADVEATLKWMALQAKQLRGWVAGSVLVSAGSALQNRFHLFDRTGVEVVRRTPLLCVVSVNRAAGRVTNALEPTYERILAAHHRARVWVTRLGPPSPGVQRILNVTRDPSAHP
jgi:predicted amidohydrolase